MPNCDPDPTIDALGGFHVAIRGRLLTQASGQDAFAESSVLIRRFHTTGTPVMLVRMSWIDDSAGLPGQPGNQPLPEPTKRFPAAASRNADGLVQPGDVLISRRQQNAVCDAELRLQSRLKGVRTSVLSGNAATFDAKAAHHAWQREYETVLIEATCDEISFTLRDRAITHVLPRIICVAYGLGFALSVA